MLLADYRTNTRDLLHDANANFYSVAGVDRWINRARKEVAKNGRCVRQLTNPTAGLASATVASAGSGYTTATVTISAPDGTVRNLVQATATANVGGGQITSITITNPGAGYVATPTITITGNGTGAAAMAALTTHTVAMAGQEVYPIAAIASTLSTLTPGLGDLLGVQSISVFWGGALKPVLARRDFSWLQMYGRSGSMLYQSNPRVWAPYGQGATGSIYLWPVPVQTMGMEVDCYFSVLDLSDTQPVDLIPEPWNEAVAFYAASKAFYNAQRFDDARTMMTEHTRLMTEARSAVTTDTIPDPYGEF